MEQHLRYEKSDTVLWAFKSNGIVLHNFSTSVFVELDGLEHVVWSYLDGSHTLNEIERILEIRHAEFQLNVDGSGETLNSLVERVLARLKAGDFVKRREA
jgi:hypothetical protein